MKAPTEIYPEKLVIECMEPVSVADVIRDECFIHQIKWDGVRGITVISGGKTEIYTKKGLPCIQSFPEFAGLSGRVKAGRAVLDGEIIVFMDGRPSFYYVLRRSLTKNEMGVKRLAKELPAVYIVFDLLFLNGKDVRGRPLEERQGMLADIFTSGAEAAIADSFEDGEALYALMKQKNMEGIVSKRLGSVYAAGKRHNDWFKTKIIKKILCVVTGILMKDGRPASLALGVYREGILTGVGAVGSGLKDSDIRQLAEYGRNEGTPVQDGIVFEKPALTCWVRFSEWTEHGTLRHPVLLGFSAEAPAEATGEELSV